MRYEIKQLDDIADPLNFGRWGVYRDGTRVFIAADQEAAEAFVARQQPPTNPLDPQGTAAPDAETVDTSNEDE